MLPERLLGMTAGWADFARQAPALATAVRALFDSYEVILLGTNSRGGRPRLSLVEPRIMDSRLVIGTSDDAKAADLRRDPRCSLHSLVGHRTHEEPVFKAAAVAREIVDQQFGGIVAALARPEIRWQPVAVFELTLESAVLTARGVLDRWHHLRGP